MDIDDKKTIDEILMELTSALVLIKSVEKVLQSTSTAVLGVRSLAEAENKLRDMLGPISDRLADLDETMNYLQAYSALTKLARRQDS